jgi:hypothetical protein
MAGANLTSTFAFTGLASSTNRQPLDPSGKFQQKFLNYFDCWVGLAPLEGQ